jgi:hypothetical protein
MTNVSFFHTKQQRLRQHKVTEQRCCFVFFVSLCETKIFSTITPIHFVNLHFKIPNSKIKKSKMAFGADRF